MNLPMNVSAYCSKPKPDMKSAHCSAVHTVMRPVGEPLLSLECVKVVGVCSVEGGPESVGELSKSGGRVGEVMTLRSYSSSASESS
jgi:hypothetical protein